ncbi:unnamed protein product [Parascedosporium putredinis]|uniref:Carboxylic ester hydrolase n=1 Tax=Parascedosporium putredinis TaxID=1442378 RepID=A0A9P1MF47_9PEZI|nr:unnamed protein product [Parascedosporium putredinis]CAI8004232.1 unnamed protein product [Parascedosporium putredinis]
MASDLGHGCVPETFGNLTLFGAEVLAVSANLVTSHSASVSSDVRFTQPSIEVQDATFCNAVGGGGWVAGRSEPFYGAMSGAVGDGYATMATDAGLGTAQDASAWALLSPGNVDLYTLQNLASVSLEDEPSTAAPAFSYWNGCSQGGRQALMLAQRYPTAYDGIASIEALTAAAIAACDGLDGVVDGIVEDVDGCRDTFDPFALVGQTFDCARENATLEMGFAAAAVANATWQGVNTAHGVRAWPGLSPSTDIAIGVAMTDCSSGTCVGVQLPISATWLSLFVLRDADADLAHLSHEEFDWLAHLSGQKYKSIIGTGDADLSAFRKAGGKLISVHGLDDQLLRHRAPLCTTKSLGGTRRRR